MASHLVRTLLGARPLLLAFTAIASVAAAVIASSPLYDPDIWWVAAAGRETLADRAVPDRNLFSFTDPDRPWVMHEWLLGPLYALGLERFGPAFFVVFTLLAFAAALSISMVAMLDARGADYERRSGATNVILLLGVVALTLFGTRLLSARPSGVAMIFPLALTAVTFGRRFTATSIVATGVIGLLWTNVHGSFPLGFVISFVSALEARTDRRARVIACGVFALVTFATPHGLALHRLVLDYVLGSGGIHREIHREINEFRSLFGAWGVTSGPSDVLGLTLVGGLAIAATRRSPHRVRGGFVLVLIALAVFQARHIELAGLLGCILLAPLAREIALDSRATARFVEDDGAAPGTAASTLSVVGSALATGLVVFMLRSGPAAPGAFISQGQPLLDSLAAIPSGARVYAPFKEASLAIWYGFPREIRVFYDPRNDCYSPETFRAYAVLNERGATRDRVLSILDGTRTSAVLVKATSPLAVLLAEAPGWQLTHRSGPFNLFERARSARARLR